MKKSIFKTIILGALLLTVSLSAKAISAYWSYNNASEKIFYVSSIMEVDKYRTPNHWYDAAFEERFGKLKGIATFTEAETRITGGSVIEDKSGLAANRQKSIEYYQQRGYTIKNIGVLIPKKVAYTPGKVRSE